MSVKIDFNTDDIFEYMENVKIACDNFAKAVAEYVTKNKYEIFKELIKENNKIMGGKKMELSDIEGNVIYGGKDDTINLLEKIAEAISKGGILIDDVRVNNFSKAIEKVGRDIIRVDQEWKKISFCYRFKGKIKEI